MRHMYGHVSELVFIAVEAGMHAAAITMGYNGAWPDVHISQGGVTVGDDDTLHHAVYESSQRALRIGWLNGEIAQRLQGAIPDQQRESLALYYFGCLLMVHHIQWERGYGKGTLDLAMSTDFCVQEAIRIARARLAGLLA